MVMLADIAVLTAKLAGLKQAKGSSGKAKGFNGYTASECSGFVMIILADIAALTAKLLGAQTIFITGSSCSKARTSSSLILRFLMFILNDIAALTFKLAVHKMLQHR